MEQILSLLKCSILVGAAVLALWAARPALGRRYQARWRCALWLVLAVALLLPAVPVRPVWSAAVEEYAPIRIEVPQPPPIVIQTPAEPAAPSQAAPPPVGIGTPPAAPLPPAAGGQGAVSSQRPAEPVRLGLPALLRGIWLAGMALFALYHLLGTALFYRRTLRWSRPAPEALREQMEQTARALGLRRTPELVVSDCVKSPMVIGLLRPRLVLPRPQWGERELDFILRHELTHYRRGDLWYKLLLLAANGVHWFNPLAYLLARAAAADLELTCDDAVVAGADQETRRAYSETLLASLHRQSGVSMALSTHFYGGTGIMKERFRNILTGGGRKRGIALLGAVLLLLAAVGCAVSLTEQKPQPLTAEELAQWQETLSEPGWTALLTHMYGSPEFIHLPNVLTHGAGLEHALTDAERADARGAFFTNLEGRAGDNLTEALGEPWENRIIGVRTADLAAYLQEYTGLNLADLPEAGWKVRYLEEYDSCYALNSSLATLQAEVLSGERQGDTLRLTIRREPGDRSRLVCEEAGIPWEDAVLTVTDGKVVSFTSSLYAGAEAAAAAVMLETAAEEDAQVFLNQPLTPRIAFRGETGDYYEWQATLRLTGEDGEPRYNSVRMMIRIDADGGTETLETSRSDILQGGKDYLTYTGIGYNFYDYIRYHYDYGLTLSRRDWSWPATSVTFYEDLQSGRAEWATRAAEDTAEQWLQACGDGLVRAETVYESPAEENSGKRVYTSSYQDVLLRLTTAGGRQVLALLSRPILQAEGIPGYWSVAGYRVETGEDLPEPDPGYRFDRILLLHAEGGVMRESTALRLSGGTNYQGGAYTDHAWDIYIPQGWTHAPTHSQEGFATYWYPTGADQGKNFLRIAWSGHADAEGFYQSYLPQYGDMENNAESFLAGNANVAWARGTRTAAGETQYTESMWLDGAQGPFEVLWTSTDPDLMNWMQMAALTFTLKGAGQKSLGLLQPAALTGQFPASPGYREVWQAADTEWIKAGNYLVLSPEGWAFRVEDYFQENAERVRSLMNTPSSRYPAPFGEIRLDSLELAWTQDSGFPREEEGAYTLFIYRADWSMYAPDAPEYAGGTVDREGWWRGDGTPYLVLEASYGKGCITRSFLMSSGYGPDSEAFQRELGMVESGLGSSVWVTEGGIDNRIGVTEHSTHPAILYDSTAGELYALHTSTAQGEG